jgi:hypothetical protein
MKTLYRIKADYVTTPSHNMVGSFAHRRAAQVAYRIEELDFFGWVKVSGGGGLIYEDAKRVMAELQNGKPLEPTP